MHQRNAKVITGSGVIRSLLDSPLEGPVYLRSSSHKLPDVVLDLDGQIDAEVAIRVDSVKGGLRATVTEAPDVPLAPPRVEYVDALASALVRAGGAGAAPADHKEDRS